MIKRNAESTIRQFLRGFPIVTITGPRQSGKTTLARVVFSGRPYVSLEDPDVRIAAIDDPRGFLERFPDGGVLDEVQRAPEILSYLQTRVDGDGRMGLFLLTGSQQFNLMSEISQSLAGRTAFIELLPFSIGELDRAGVRPNLLDAMLFNGCYPPLYDRDLSPGAWFRSYVTAYVERDVRQLLKVQDLEAFQRFLRFCAGRSGQILNLSSLATDCGITHNTARAWISVLEASYILFTLRPHHANFNKRLVKSPKIYFYDTGLLCWLLGIREQDQLAAHPLRGSIFETFIVSELVKTRFNQGEKAGLHFWRDSNGNEVDVIAEVGTLLQPIEIKSGKTLNRGFFIGLERWQTLAGDRATCPTLIYGGRESLTRKEVNVSGWEAVGRVLEK
ncbi:MAG: ATP-binding protein [Deltaproteobacteria bacterium]|nr:ATP-binding protein [Deltaproteobacteria bacterium]